MKADPTKYNLTGAKKKKSPSIADRAYGAVTRVGKVAKSFNEAVLPIKEVTRIVKGKGSKGDYAYTALSALPIIGKAGKVAGAGSKIAGKVKIGGKVGEAATTKVTSAISKSYKPIGKSGKASSSIARSGKTPSQIKKVVVNDTNRTMRASELKQIRAAAFNQRNSTSKAFGKFNEASSSIARSGKTPSQIKKVVVNDTNRTMRSADLQKLKNNRAMLESKRAQPKPNRNLGRQGRIETRRASVESRRLQK